MLTVRRSIPREQEGPGTRAEFADRPTRIDPLEQGASKQPLEIRARVDGALLKYRTVRAAHDIPARLAAGLERIEERTSGRHRNKVERRSHCRPSRSWRRSKLDGSNLQH